MRLTEREIDEILAGVPEDVQPSNEFKRRLGRLLKRLKADPAYPLPRRRMSVSAAALALVFMTASTAVAGAAISKFQERMEMMSEYEIEKNVSDLQKALEHADSFSRELSAQEMEQMKEMAVEYEKEGRFPEGELLVVNSETEWKAGGPVFVAESSTFVLPGEELSEEDMLEILDFLYKRDYSLETVNVVRAENETGTKADALTEDEAVRIARKLAESLTDMDVDSCETVLSSNMDEVTVENSAEGIQVEFIKDDESFVVFVENDTKKITSFELDSNIAGNTDIVVDENLYREKYPEIMDFLTSQIGVMEPVESSFCLYYVDEEKETLYGKVSYYFQSGNNYYVLRYDAENGQIQELSIVIVDEFNSVYDINNEQLLKRGIQSRQIDFMPLNTKEKDQEELK